MAFQLDKKWLIAGAAAVVILIVIVKARSSSSGGGTTVVPQTVTGATTGAAAISTGQLASFETQLTTSLDKAISQLQATQPAASGTTSPTNPSAPVATGGGTPVTPPAAATPAPTGTSTGSGSGSANVTPVGPPPGSVSVDGVTLNYIDTPQAGAALAKAGQTIDAVIAGSIVPVVVAGHRTAAFAALPSGTRLYDQPKA